MFKNCFHVVVLSVRYGPFHALESAFIDRLKSLIAQGQPADVAVVAPSRRQADRLERLAAVEHGLALLGVEFHTFHSLAAAVLDEGGFPDKKLIGDPVFHDRLVDRILEEKPALASFFGGEARPRALAGALRSSLRDLIDAGVEPASLEEHFGDALLKDPRERERLGALLALARAYEAKLEALKILSPSGVVKLAAERAADSAYLAGRRELLYYGFYDLTGLQLDFFEAVAARAPAVVYFPYRSGHPAFRFAEPFFDEKLRGHEAVEVQAAAGAPALSPALDRLFGPGSAKIPEGALQVVAASGERDEAWAAAKEILRLVESGRFGFEDIGVVARTLEPYRGVVAEVFAENAIPYDMGSPEPLLRQPLVKSCLNLLRLRQADFPAAVVEDLFGSPYFRPQPPPGSRRLRHWRKLIRALGIRAGWLQWRGKLESRANEDFELAPGREDGKIPKTDVAALWDWVSGLERELRREASSWTELSVHAAALLERHLGLPENARPEEPRAWELVVDALESLALFDLLGGKPSWEEFLESFEEKLRRAALERESAGRGVRVMDAMDARGQPFGALIVLGLKEKLFPRLVQEDPLLREPARAALRHPAGYWIVRKSAGYEEERLLFYLTAAAARERLICVYPRSDEAGKAQVPSLYLRELCRAAGIPLADAARVPRQPAEKLRACEPRLLAPKEFRLLSALEGGLPPEESRRVAALNRFGKPGPHDGLVGAPEEHLKRLRREGLSPSALDAFARCPFQYFADRVLGLGRAEEGAEKGEFAAWVRGKIYHAVLERFHAGDGGAADKRLDAAIEAVFAEYDWKKMGVYPLLWLSAKQQMSARLREFAAWDLAERKASGFAPRWLEKELSADWPGAAPAALAGLRLHGVIDRVDVDGGGRFRIVDYKSRWRKRGKLAKLIADGELHQLPLYAELAGEALGPEADFAEAAIYSLEDSEETSGFARAQVYDAGQWSAGRQAFFEQVAARLERIARGEFPINPEDGEFGHCGYCDFAGVCRKSHGPSRSRAASS